MDGLLCPKCGGATPTQELEDGLPPCVECGSCGTVYWPPAPMDVEEFVKGRTGRIPGRPATHLMGRFVRVKDGVSEALEGWEGLVEKVSGPFCRVLLDEATSPLRETRVWMPSHWLEPND